MDIRIPLTCVLLVGGMVGLALPLMESGDRLREYDRPESMGGPQQQFTIGAAKARPEQWADEVTLSRESDGHFYANVTIDGMSTRMLVDTGASVVALTAEDAAALGHYWIDDDLKPVAAGAGGAVNGMNISLDQVEVGGFVVEDVPAMILPDLGISLLGQSFLSKIKKVEIEDDSMVLGG